MDMVCLQRHACQIAVELAVRLLDKVDRGQKGLATSVPCSLLWLADSEHTLQVIRLSNTDHSNSTATRAFILTHLERTLVDMHSSNDESLYPASHRHSIMALNLVCSLGTFPRAWFDIVQLSWR